MKPFKKFPKIGQFKDVIKSVEYNERMVGKDENGDPIFDKNVDLPTLEFEGTVKLHGSNGGVCWMKNEDGSFEMATQSRKNIITPESDNNGFSHFINNEIDNDKLFNEVRECVEKVYKDYAGFGVYGEWCGKGVNKGTAINSFEPKIFVVFSIIVFTNEDLQKEEDKGVWLDDDHFCEVKFSEPRVHNIHQYLKFYLRVNFNDPKASTDKINEYISSVEEQCPVGKDLGIEGPGEGLVFRCMNEGYKSSRFWFKAKGEKHKDTKTKDKTPVDNERVESIKRMVDNLLTETRLEKGIEHLKENGKGIDRKNLGDFLKWVQKDIMEEEGENIEQNGFEPKELNKEISNKAKDWFFKKEEEQIFG